jgi:hypothetical protein
MHEKGRKDYRAARNMCVKGGEIEVVALSEGVWPRKISSHQIRGKTMGGIRKKGKPPGKDSSKPKKASPKPVEDDDYEDGDIATPKRDRYGEDDEPW